jgi:tRNA threonylcarbamoyl adenosine modification protein (Sua5/YciO/YrdC/YwlC family)
MSAEFISIHPDNPQENRLNQVIEILKKGGIIIYPTDTVYGIGCDLMNQSAVEKLCRLKKVDPKRMHLSFICSDLSNLSKYAKDVTTPIFKLMKKTLPGPYTFILESTTSVPKILGTKKKQVGIRIPNHKIPVELVKRLGNPLITTSVRHFDDLVEYYTDPQDIYEDYKNLVDAVIDGGICGNIPSTVINCIDENFEVYREGLGEVKDLLA